MQLRKNVLDGISTVFLPAQVYTHTNYHVRYISPRMLMPLPKKAIVHAPSISSILTYTPPVHSTTLAQQYKLPERLCKVQKIVVKRSNRIFYVQST